MICIGGSHTNCVAAAAVELGRTIPIIRLKQIAKPLELRDGAWELAPELSRQLQDPMVFSMIGGNRHNMMGLLQHPRPFDFVLPRRPDLPLDPELELVPYAAIRNTLTRLMKSHLGMFSCTVKAAPSVVWHIVSPPPPRDTAWVAANLDKVFRAIDAPVVSATLRMKLWLLQAEIMRATCRKAGALFLGPPGEAVDGDGFLRAEYRHDATHANSRYGALIIGQMEQLR